MFLQQTISSLLTASFCTTEPFSPLPTKQQHPTDPTQPGNQKSPPVPHDEDSGIFDDYLDETKREALAEEKQNPSKYCTLFMFIGQDVTQHILEYSTTYDLSAHVRGVNRDFQSIVNTSNGWFTNRLMPSRGVQDCVQVTRVMMHTYIFGKDINEKALAIKPHGDPTIFNNIFFGSATRLWAYEDSTTQRFSDFPTMHEVVMTWCHGLEFLSKQFFRLLLDRLGMDEKNLSAKDRRKLRKMYLEYKSKLEKEGLRMVDTQAQRRSPVGYDWRWLDRIQDNKSEVDPTYPICYAHPFLNDQVARRRIDPLVMMGLLRNREMSRRFCHLFVDVDDATPMLIKDLKDIRACLKSYVIEMIAMGQEEDVPFVRALLTNVRNERSRAALSPEFVTKRIIDVYEGSFIRRRVLIMNSNGGFDMDWHMDEKSVQQRLLFARALLPMCLSRIGESAVRANPRLTKLLDDLEPKGDEDDALKKELKQMFWSCF